MQLLYNPIPMKDNMLNLETLFFHSVKIIFLVLNIQTSTDK